MAGTIEDKLELLDRAAAVEAPAGAEDRRRPTNRQHGRRRGLEAELEIMIADHPTLAPGFAELGGHGRNNLL